MSGPQPKERRETVREELRRHLKEGWLTALQLSSLLGLSEKALPPHLEHLRKSSVALGEQLEIEPAVCSGCDFTFEQRDRFTRPSRCPECKGERIEAPRFRITTK